MKCSQSFILISCLVLVSLISACDRSNSQIVQGSVDTTKSAANPQDVDSVLDEEDCLDDEHTTNLSTSSSASRLGSTAALSCPIKY